MLGAMVAVPGGAITTVPVLVRPLPAACAQELDSFGDDDRGLLAVATDDADEDVDCC